MKGGPQANNEGGPTSSGPLLGGPPAERGGGERGPSEGPAEVPSSEGPPFREPGVGEAGGPPAAETGGPRLSSRVPFGCPRRGALSSQAEGDDTTNSGELDSFNPASSSPRPLPQRQQQDQQLLLLESADGGRLQMTDYLTGREFQFKRPDRQQQQQPWTEGEVLYPLLQYRRQQQQQQQQGLRRSAAAASFRKGVVPVLLLCLLGGALLQQRALWLSKEGSRLETQTIPALSRQLLHREEAATGGTDTWARLSLEEKASYNSKLHADIEAAHAAIEELQQKLDAKKQERILQQQQQQQQQQAFDAAVERLGETGSSLRAAYAAVVCSRHEVEGLIRQTGVPAAAAAVTLQQLQQYYKEQKEQAAALEARVLLLRMILKDIKEIHTEAIQLRQQLDQQQRQRQEQQRELQDKQQQQQQQQRVEQQKQQQHVQQQQRLQQQKQLQLRQRPEQQKQQQQQQQMQQGRLALDKEIAALTLMLAEARVALRSPPQADKQQQQQPQEQQQEEDEQARQAAAERSLREKELEALRLRLERAERQTQELHRRSQVWRSTFLGPLAKQADHFISLFLDAARDVESDGERLLRVLRHADAREEALPNLDVELLWLQDAFRRVRAVAADLEAWPSGSNSDQQP
ncbi:hypothetical protein Efla_002474 [Eimeria flavescens]